MSTLLLRLAAPLQAWGGESKFERRVTNREPTKSGVIGMLAAALGRRRDESIDDLAALCFGVRIDQPGQMVKDFHTARKLLPRKKGSFIDEYESYVTLRYYLADAVFLVGLEGETKGIKELEDAVNSPVFPLYLGRRSCPPCGRVSLGVREKPLMLALREEPWLAGEWYRKKSGGPISLTLVTDADKPGGIRRRDLPVSFSPTHRRYAFRNIDDIVNAVNVDKTEHDAFAALDGREESDVSIPD
jgi:CRISPR system Cascade subunit CasD